MTRQIQDIAKPHLPGCPWVTTSPKTLDFALRTQKEAATYCDKTQSALPNQRAGRAYSYCLRRRRQCGYITPKAFLAVCSTAAFSRLALLPHPDRKHCDQAKSRHGEENQ